MPTLLDFRRRIRSVKNTQQITRAMKFVAAARLRRRIESPQHPLLAKRPEERILVLLLTGERGLAGAFNTNILKKGAEFYRSKAGKQITVIPIGKKGRDSLRRAGFTFAGEYVNVLSRVDFGIAREISNLVTSLYTEEKVDAVYTIFSEFRNVISADLVVEKLLPVEKITAGDETEAAAETSQIDYIHEQPEDELLKKLLPRYVETQVLRSMLESCAAEHAARMTAMEAATKNAGEVIEGLTLHMNKVRQAAITKEIIEIVSGASSTA